MIERLIFATTNQSKVNRLKQMLSNSEIDIVTLNEFKHLNLIEPEEYGNSESENATIKAKFYKSQLGPESIILSQDDGVYTPDLPLYLQAGKDIKATIAANMGEFNRVNTIAYWQYIANIYPETACNIRVAFCLYDTHIEHFEVIIKCRFRTNNSNIESLLDGDLLSPFVETLVEGNYKCFQDFTDQDYIWFGKYYYPSLIWRLLHNS
jgi:Ham1 family